LIANRAIFAVSSDPQTWYAAVVKSLKGNSIFCLIFIRQKYHWKASRSYGVFTPSGVFGGQRHARKVTRHHHELVYLGRLRGWFARL
jgi:hypothetical protein